MKIALIISSRRDALVSYGSYVVEVSNKLPCSPVYLIRKYFQCDSKAEGLNSMMNQL